MSLQRRLTLFFILIVILPLVVAGLVVQRVVVGEFRQRSNEALRPALTAAALRYNERVQGIEAFTRAAVTRNADFARLLSSGDRARINGFLDDALAPRQGLDFLVALDDGGRLAGSAFEPASFAAGFSMPSVDEIIAQRKAAGFLRTPEIEIQQEGGGKVGSVIGGFWIDAQMLTGSDQADVETFVLLGDRVIAGTSDIPVTSLDLGATGNDLRASTDERGGSGIFELDIDGSGRARTLGISGTEMRFLAWTSDAPVGAVSRQVITSMVLLFFIALAVTSLLAWVLARLITRPLEELSAAAAAISEGRFDHQIPVRSTDEIGQLAESFNQMSGKLSETVSDLASSRDLLQRAVHRVGETLRSTHDMKQILGSIINTAAEAVGADTAVLWMFSPTREELYPHMTYGMDKRGLGKVKVGDGLVGLVAERGVTVKRPSRSGGPTPTRAEPDSPVTIALPLYSGNRMRGVISVYRSDEEDTFSTADFNTVVFLAEQGATAIENVLLHEEAQRLSLTDGLTGVWNRRFLQMQSRQVVATAARFGRPFSILMLDLDNFKVVNDTYGHQRGDDILVEFARRVDSVLREVDTFVRYGGEEFVALLSETDVEGARATGEKVREAVGSEPFDTPGEEPIRLTVSVGVASFPLHAERFDELLEAADQALYRAKQEGRDRVKVAGSYSPDLHVAK